MELQNQRPTSHNSGSTRQKISVKRNKNEVAIFLSRMTKFIVHFYFQLKGKFYIFLKFWTLSHTFALLLRLKQTFSLLLKASQTNPYTGIQFCFFLLVPYKIYLLYYISSTTASIPVQYPF